MKELCDLKIDEEFRTFYPPMDSGVYEELEELILEEGIRDALVVWNGTIVDGHHRYEIAKKHGLSFEVIEKDFSSREEALLWIGKNSFGRRNLDQLDKCLTALKMEPILKIAAKKRQGTRNDLKENNFSENFRKSIAVSKNL